MRDVVEAPVLIGGKRHKWSSHPVFNPAAVDTVVGYSAEGDAAAVHAAVLAAAEAAPGWAAATAAQRQQALNNAAQSTLDDFDSRATLLTSEQGKALWESNIDIAGAPYLLAENARLAEKACAEDVVENSRGRFVKRRRPAGVVAVIVPWNYPVVLAFNAIAPALVAGNTVVVKPSELAPLALTQTLISAATALPAGVLDVVPGLGADAGAPLAAHPLVRRVVFTGGTATGRKVMTAAASSLAGVSLELGGNDPAVILESAVIDDELVEQIRHSAFTCSGQICFAAKRIYVHRSHYRRFVELMAEAVDEMSVGDGLDPRTTIGPLIDATAKRRVESLIRESRDDGATVRELGKKVDATSWSRGHFVLPHLVTDIRQEAELVACEQFGPVLPILPFDDDDEAVALANDSQYGLAASVWSRDDDHASDVARRIESGTVFINVHRAGASDHTTPFGGVKQSGIGRSNGWASVEELTEVQILIRRDDVASLPARPADTGT